MNIIEPRRSSKPAFNRLVTSSMANVNLTNHNNNKKTHAYLPRSELPLNVIDYSYVPKRTLMNTDQLTNRLKNGQNSLNSQIDVLIQQLSDQINTSEQQQQRNKSRYQTPTMSYHIHIPPREQQQQQQSVFNLFEFLNEINRFKIRLDVLEKERYELEEKVRQLQAENLNYKNHFLHDNDEWFSSQSISILNGQTTSMSAAENDIERLKRRVESLVKSNDEKEKKIEDLQVQLAKCQTTILPPTTNNNHTNNSDTQKAEYEADGDISDSNSSPSLNSYKDSQLSQQRSSSSHHEYDAATDQHQQQPLIKTRFDGLHRAASAEPMLNRELAKTPSRSLSKGTLSSNKHINHKYDQGGYISDGPSQKYSMYKKGSITNLDKAKSSSVKGLKNIFGRIIRTNSETIRDGNEQQNQNSFRRGSLRTTTTNGKNLSKPLSPLETTFARWQTEQVVNWLYGIGLGQYASECRKHFKNGLQLLHATPQELEKKIGMRNPLHRKKLYLCLNSLCTRQVEANCLDTYWVQKWLDDIGLPQYKEYFAESKVDGRILNNLTLEDIIYLNITNELHHLSIKHSIQVLRLNNFNSTCMKRRPNPEDKNNINEIMYWSNHRVMEWLRSIDLSEYAPNLRGSGVCGALIVLELRFNVSTLAEILSIPMSKTLLRRHLSMRFQELIGNDLQNRKNHYEKSPNCQPLTLHTKIKFPRGLFAHRRTRPNDVEGLVCPLNENGIPNGIPADQKQSQRKESPMVATLEDELSLSQDSPTTIV